MKHIMSAMKDEKHIIDYFDKGLNPFSSSNFYSDTLQYINTEYGNAVNNFVQKASKDNSNIKVDYTRQMEDLKNLYQ